MRLFGKADGTVDRHDRAGWLSAPFDLAYRAPAAPTPPPRRTTFASRGYTLGPDPARSAGKGA